MKSLVVEDSLLGERRFPPAYVKVDSSSLMQNSAVHNPPSPHGTGGIVQIPWFPTRLVQLCINLNTSAWVTVSQLASSAWFILNVCTLLNSIIARFVATALSFCECKFAPAEYINQLCLQRAITHPCIVLNLPDKI